MTKTILTVFSEARCIYRMGQKMYYFTFVHIFAEKSTDFQNFFTVAFYGQLAITWLLNLPCEVQMQEKLTIIDSKRVDRQNTLFTKNAVNDLYDATLC